MEDRFNYLKYFLTVKKNEGHFIFKVEGINFNSEPLEIFGVKFYNPQRNKYLKYFKVDEENKNKENEEFCKKVELFHLEKDDKGSLDSKCNVIVPIKYFYEDVDYFDSFNFPTKTFIEAFSKAKISFIEFKRLLKSFSIEYFFDESLLLAKVSKESILIDDNFNYHKVSNIQKLKEITFKVDEIRRDMMIENLKYKEKIKLQNTFFYHIANSNALISEYILEYHKFNFKSLWIECIEPYFNGKNEFISFAKKCVKIRTSFFSKYRILLSNALRYGAFSGDSYCLNKEKMKNIGIGDLNVGDKIFGDDLEMNFELLPSGSLLDEFKDEMRVFVNDEDIFLKKIDNWISETVKVVYDERNIEVHYNIVDYYNDISIKKDILFISSCVIGAINDAIFSMDVKNIEEAKKYLEKKYLEGVN